MRTCRYRWRETWHEERTFHDIEWVCRLRSTHSGPGLGTRQGVGPLWTNGHQGGLQLSSHFPKGCAPGWNRSWDHVVMSRSVYSMNHRAMSGGDNVCIEVATVMKKHGPNSENISQAVLRLGTKQWRLRAPLTFLHATSGIEPQTLLPESSALPTRPPRQPLKFETMLGRHHYSSTT